MIECRQAELDWLFSKYEGKPAAIQPEAIDSGEWTQADRDLCARIRQSKQGDKWQKLFDGRYDGYERQSEADFALCIILAFWCGKDDKQMDRIFRQSKLYRPKWDEIHGQRNCRDRYRLSRLPSSTRGDAKCIDL